MKIETGAPQKQGHWNTMQYVEKLFKIINGIMVLDTGAALVRPRGNENIEEVS